MLHDASLAHSVDVHVVDHERAAGWREHANRRMLERPCVGAAASDEMDHVVSADDLLFDVEPKIGERRSPRRHDRADECPGVRASVAEVRELVAEEVIDGSDVAVVPDDIEVRPYELGVVPLARVVSGWSAVTSSMNRSRLISRSA
jgi:hypothetical protein